MPITPPFSVTIVNNSLVPADMFVTVQGNDPITKLTQQSFNPGTAAWQAAPLSFKLSSLAANVLQLPFIESGRVYLSIGAGLDFSLGAPSAANVADPNYGMLWDQFEVSFLPASRLSSIRPTSTFSASRSA